MPERKYTVAWQRAGESEIQVCKGLTLRTAIARLRRAIRATGGPITIHSVTYESGSAA